MSSRVALDLDVFSRLVRALNWNGGPEPDGESVAAVRIYLYVTNPWITPTVAAEIEERKDPLEITWRNYQFSEISHPDEFYRGCVKGMSQRYIDYYPDPRDCRLVAEAECAKLETLLTLRADLIKGMRARAEVIGVMTPSDYWNRAHMPRGAVPRIKPQSENPLSSAAWWRW